MPVKLEKKDWLAGGLLSALAAVLYFASMANYLFPGESAHLISVWSGLNSSTITNYPLMKIFAGIFNYGNAIAPIAGAIAVGAIYILVAFFIRLLVKAQYIKDSSIFASRIGGAVAAVVFMLIPAVREASTHLEPRIFDVALALFSFLLFIPYINGSKNIAWVYPILISVLAAFGLTDSPLFLLLLPLYLLLTFSASRLRGGKGYTVAMGFLVIFIIAFFAYAPFAFGDFKEGLLFLKNSGKAYIAPRNWMLVFFFSVLPFVISIFSSRKSFRETAGWTQWIFHIAMTFISILAIATPLAPSSLMKPFGVLPVAASVCASFTIGYIIAYWILQIKAIVLNTEAKVSNDLLKVGRCIALVAGGIYFVVLMLSSLLSLFAFDRNAGKFADDLADKIIADLGDRTWFVTDGTLDDHLRLAAKRNNHELNLICLQRDTDKKYLSELRAIVKEKKLAGERNEDLLLSISLGVLTFIQDWFSFDPEAAKSVAMYGSPDLWYAAKIKPVPELLFFGSDPKRTPDWSKWKEYDKLLFAPKGWGSYKLWSIKDPLERMRLDLRRHMGLIANNRGVWLQDEKKDDEAFKLYETVLTSIDADNICSLFNEFELARTGNKLATAKQNEILKKLEVIKKDEDRRYRLWALANYYGYIRSPEIFMRLGFNWARSGRPGEALQQINRAIDFVPSDKRTAFINMMAALYASEDNQSKSREMYSSVLEKDAENHDALIGLMRLELLDGNSEKAMEYLAKATAKAGDTPAMKIELALLHMMRGENDKAIDVLKRVTLSNPENLQAWSLLGAVTIQKIDATKDQKVREVEMKYLEDVVLRTMEKQARSPNDYYLQTTRAFLLLRKTEDRRREARDALVVASKTRPDIAATSDIILDLDISLNDVEHAEQQAREVLRRNRKAPLANYVMGSLALQNGRIVEAETFLHRAVDTKKPVILALNDLAELLRRNKKYDEAERYARNATKANPNLYVSWETLGSILVEKNGNLEEAERCIRKAIELSTDKDGRETDVRMLITLARCQIARKDTARVKPTLRKVKNRISELNEFERREFEELLKSVK